MHRRHHVLAALNTRFDANDPKLHALSRRFALSHSLQHNDADWKAALFWFYATDWLENDRVYDHQTVGLKPVH